MAKSFLPSDLNQFTGSEHWYRHPLVCDILFTDGAHYVAENGGAFWLLDTIALAQRDVPKVAALEFQVWRMTVWPECTATINCEDGNGNVVFTKHIGFTNFPLESVELWFENKTIYLPSEH